MSSLALNAALQSSAIAALGSALDSGLKAESAILDTVRALSFLALDKVGRDQKAGEWNGKIGPAFNSPYTIVLKSLIFKGKAVYRDSANELAAVRQIPVSKRSDREAAVNDYIKACKGKDVVWTIGQVRALAAKVVKLACEKHRDDVVTIALVPQPEEQVRMFGEFFDNFVGGKSYAALVQRFKAPAKEGEVDAVDTIGKAIAKLTDEDAIRAVIAAAQAHLADIAKAKAMVAEMNGDAPDDSDVEVDNVVQMAA